MTVTTRWTVMTGMSPRPGTVSRRDRGGHQEDGRRRDPDPLAEPVGPHGEQPGDAHDGDEQREGDDVGHGVRLALGGRAAMVRLLEDVRHLLPTRLPGSPGPSLSVLPGRRVRSRDRAAALEPAARGGVAQPAGPALDRASRRRRGAARPAPGRPGRPAAPARRWSGPAWRAWSSPARPLVTLPAARRPAAVSRTAVLRPSRPATRRTWPAASSRSTRRTVPEWVRPRTCRSRSMDGSGGRTCTSADSAVAPLSAWAAAPSTASAIRSVRTRASAPRTLAARAGSGPSGEQVVKGHGRRVPHRRLEASRCR